MPRLRGIDPWIIDVDSSAVGLQFMNDIHHFRIADIRAIFLECQTQHQHTRTTDMNAFVGHEPHEFGCNVRSHVVIEAPTSQNHLGVVTDFSRLVRQIVRVDTNAMTADQAWSKRQKIPFRACGLQHLFRVYAEPLEYECQFVDQGDVKVALRVFDDLGGFGDSDAVRLVRTGAYDRAVELIDEGRRLPWPGWRPPCDRCWPAVLC